MRFGEVFFALLVPAIFGNAQAATQSLQARQSPPTEIQIRHLNVVSDDLPAADRERVIRCLQGHAYVSGEFEERTRQSLRDLGYYFARVDGAEISEVHEDKSGKSADVTLKVKPGQQYHLGFIGFKHATLFSPDQLRSQFPIQTGSLFCASSVGYGLEKVKSLYQDKGHINFGAIPLPTIDESHHTVDLTIDLDEGQQYVFGHLTLDGVEPGAGTGKALMEAWEGLQGKTYNAELLTDWLKSNWPATTQNQYYVRAAENDPRQVNLFLQFR